MEPVGRSRDEIPDSYGFASCKNRRSGQKFGPAVQAQGHLRRRFRLREGEQRMKIHRAIPLAFSFLALCDFVPARAYAQTATPALGVVTKATAAHIGNAAAGEGATIYSGDYLSTEDNG